MPRHNANFFHVKVHCILGTGLGLEMLVLVDIILPLTLFRTVYKHLAFSQFYYYFKNSLQIIHPLSAFTGQ